MSKSLNLVICTLLFVPALVAADEESYTNYDSIVTELRSNMDDKPLVAPQDDFNWEEVAIHGGLGFSTTWASVAAPSGIEAAGLLKGVTANFGVNLFTRKLRAEGAFSSFAQDSMSDSFKASLKEFELRVMYVPTFNRHTVMRFGLGLTARYLDVATLENGAWTDYQATTPSSVIMIGFERKITPTLAVGPDVSYRNALISDTFDKSAWNASFRLNATF